MMETFGMPTTGEFAEHLLRCTESRDIRFTGKLLGEVEGVYFCRVKLYLYVTLAGNYVCFYEFWPLQNPKLNSMGKVCKNQEEIFEFFGEYAPQRIAKNLYDVTGLEDAIDVP